MSLRFHVLNVGHGSSIIVELIDEGQRTYGLIDSNRTRAGTVKALSRLKQWRVEKLSFVCITHPHADHYTGMRDVITEYNGKIGQFFTFPMFDILNDQGRIGRWGHALKKLRDRTVDKVIKSAAEELMWIIRWACENRTIWIQCDGDENRIAPVNFHNVTIQTILPPRKAKGDYLQMIIDRSDPMAFATTGENDISLALQFEYKGKKVVLGGDGSEENWKWRREGFQERSKTKVDAQAVNLPHHGSKIDCSIATLSQLFEIESGKPTFGITSADGQSHPDLEVIERMEAQGTKPYCTNLLSNCGANASKLENQGGLDPELARWLREVSYSSGLVQPCQGDICVEIDQGGELHVTSEFSRPCDYRGDYGTLFAIT